MGLRLVEAKIGLINELTHYHCEINLKALLTFRIEAFAIFCDCCIIFSLESLIHNHTIFFIRCREK